MRVKYLDRKLIIRKDNFIILVSIMHNRIVAIKNGVYYDNEAGSIYKTLHMTEVVCELVKIFSFDLEILEILLRVHSNKLSSFIKDNIPNWKFNINNNSYTVAKVKELKVYYGRQSINVSSIMFLLSNYFTFFEGNYAVNKKKQYIESICQYHNVEVSLKNALLSIKIDYNFYIEEATNIDLVKYLESYSKYVWK